VGSRAANGRAHIHDSNAIFILGDDDCELGYVPREGARDIAPLLDAGAEADARVHRLWETPEGEVVPIVLANVRQGYADPLLSSGVSGGEAGSTQPRERQQLPNRKVVARQQRALSCFYS
jgi:HIRAN domain